MKTNATQEILKYMKNHKKGITSYEAFERFGATRLSSLIYSLKKQGNIIKTIDKQVKTRYGKTTIVATYVLVKEAK